MVCPPACPMQIGCWLLTAFEGMQPQPWLSSCNALCNGQELVRRLPQQEGQSPSIPHFVKACSILCGSSKRETKCLVSFELRSEEVKNQFLQAVAEHSLKAKLIPKGSLPRGCQIDYIELYELTKG
eukprot:687339-Pelagomonas_calceolata.AAC.2